MRGERERERERERGEIGPLRSDPLSKILVNKQAIETIKTPLEIK